MISVLSVLDSFPSFLFPSHLRPFHLLHLLGLHCDSNILIKATYYYKCRNFVFDKNTFVQMKVNDIKCNRFFICTFDAIILHFEYLNVQHTSL